MGNLFISHKPTNGCEAVHSIGMRAPGKVHDRQKRGQTKCLHSAGESDGSAYPLGGPGLAFLTARLLQRPLDHGSLGNLSKTEEATATAPSLSATTQAHYKPSAVAPCQDLREGGGGRGLWEVKCSFSLRRDIFQALVRPNHALSTLETGSVVTLGQEQPVWLREEWGRNAARPRAEIRQGHNLSKSIWAGQGGRGRRPRGLPHWRLRGRTLPEPSSKASLEALLSRAPVCVLGAYLGHGERSQATRWWQSQR